MTTIQVSIPLFLPEAELLIIVGFNQIIQSVASIVGPALGAFIIESTS